MDDDCQVELLTKTVTEDDVENARMATLAVWGLTSPNCGRRVRNVLLRLDGVVSATIDVKHGMAFVDYVPSKTNPHELILAVAGASDDERHQYQAALIT